MAQIFISYSRVDIAFIEQLYKRLQQIRPTFTIWYDQAAHGLLGGDDWWETILDAIAKADIFIYVLSNESIESQFCQAEFKEARRLQKRIITIQARDRTTIKGDLGSIQYVDMKHGVDDPDAIARLSGALDHQMAQVRKLRPLYGGRTPKPIIEPTPTRNANAPDVDTPTLEVRNNLQPANKSWWKKPEFVIGAILIPILAAIIGAVIQNMENTPPTTPVTEVATHTPEPTLTDTPEPMITPTDLPIAFIVGTLDAQATIDQATAYAEETIAARLTGYAIQTQQSIDATATATVSTNTPTPDITASIEAFRTEQAETATQAWVDSWTNTPTITPTPNATATLIAFRPATNDDWTPIERDFNGVVMVLVPAGCFDMGSNSDENDEHPIHQICFDEPFWIDKYEVTNEQYGSTASASTCTQYSSEPDQPRNCMTWFEASGFCVSRDAHLPTEAEWEYAARGVDGWVYSWGDTYDVSLVIGEDDPIYGDIGTAPVGSRPEGMSWVGAMDMSGNVWEWVSSWYLGYPYDEEHEHDINEYTYRVLRGGSFSVNSEDLRSANRIRSLPANDYYYFNFGFRCARSMN